MSNLTYELAWVKDLIGAWFYFLESPMSCIVTIKLSFTLLKIMYFMIARNRLR